MSADFTDQSGFGRLICGLGFCSFRFSRCLCSRLLLSLCLQGSLFALLSFLGFLHLKTLLDLFLLLCSVKNILDRAGRALGILDRAGRALGRAHTALDALLGIDDTEVILNGDRALRADSCALSASDTCSGTSLSGICALLLVVAADLNLRGLRDDLDQLLRACLCACAAACAIVASDNGYTVNDVDRVELTGLYAVAETDTAVRTLLASAEQLLLPYRK